MKRTEIKIYKDYDDSFYFTDEDGDRVFIDSQDEKYLRYNRKDNCFYFIN